MKKILVLIGIIAGSVISASAQQTANLNITLSDVLSFTVNQPGSLTVNFDTEEKYSNGITALAVDHITVVSSKGFTVKAVSGTIQGTSALSASSVKLTSSIGSTNGGNTAGITYSTGVTLPASGSAAATVITSANSSWNGTTAANKFNISYLIGANGAYAGKAVATNNVIPVTYTVTQP